MSEALALKWSTLTGIRAEYLKGITKDPLVVLDMDKILSDEKIVVNVWRERRFLSIKRSKRRTR